MSVNFKYVKSAALASASLVLVACASTPNPLSVEQRDQYFVKNTNVVWNLSEKEQAVEDKKDTNDNGKRAAGRKSMEAKLTTVVTEEFINSPSGPNAVDMNIAITRYDRVGSFTGNVLGAGSDILVADVVVTDTVTGDEIAVYEDIRGFRQTGFGVIGAIAQSASNPDIEGIMAVSFAKKLRKRFDK